jgi:hypothetical protein
MPELIDELKKARKNAFQGQPQLLLLSFFSIGFSKPGFRQQI